MNLDCGNSFLVTIFVWLAKLTVKYPRYLIIIPLVVSAVLSTGMFKMVLLRDIEYLFPPIDSRAYTDRDVIQKYFPMNYSHDFEEGRQILSLGYGATIITAKDGGSVLRKHIFDEIEVLDAIIRNISVRVNDTIYRYQDNCARDLNGNCYKVDLLDMKYSLEDIKNGIYNIKYPMEINNKTWEVKIFGNCLGDVELEGSKIKSAKAAYLIYYLDSSSDMFKDINVEWENIFLETMQSVKFEYIDATMMVSSTLYNEFNSDTINAMGYFTMTIAIMLIFSVVSNMMSDCVRSKPWAGILGCISSTISVTASGGLLLYCGVEYFSINLGVPFIMLGIGMDDTFVLLAAWRRTKPTDTLEQRMCETYRHAGVAITITSLTTFTSFLVGTLTPFRAANLMCSYLAIAVLFTYIYQLTFFGGCMVYMGMAEQKRLHALFLVPVKPKSLSKHEGRWHQMWMTGGIDPKNPDNPEDNQEHQGMAFFRDVLGELLCRPRIKLGVVVCFMVYIAGAIYGAMQFREGLEMYQLFSEGSYAYNYAIREKQYFYKYKFRVQIVITEPLDYSDALVQNHIEDTLSELESLPSVNPGPLSESWLRYFKIFLKDKRTQLLTRKYNLTDKIDFINCIRNVYFKYPPAKRFMKDLVFNENHTDIIASRYIIQMENMTDTVMGKEFILTSWDILDSVPFATFSYHNLFLVLTMLMTVKAFTLHVILLTSGLMLIITFLFIPNLAVVTWVVFSICSIELGVLGYMTLWGVNLNLTSLVSLILCIGFSIDNAAHIAYAFVSTKSNNVDDKLKKALHFVGFPIMQASLSTVIGVLVLIFTPSYNFHVFFKTITLVMIFATSHSLLLLPVLLSVFDPIFNKHYKEEENSNGVKKSAMANLLPTRQHANNIPTTMV